MLCIMKAFVVVVLIGSVLDAIVTVILITAEISSAQLYYLVRLCIDIIVVWLVEIMQ